MRYTQPNVQLSKNCRIGLYCHIRQDERFEIAILRKKGYSVRTIACAMGRNPASVSRELKRNSSIVGAYDAVKAQHKAYVKRLYSKYQGMKVRESPELEKYIYEKMRLSWSPEQIAGRLRLETKGSTSLSPETIYMYLYHNPIGYGLCKYLRYKHIRRRKRKSVKNIREIIKNRVFIDQRPEIINSRMRYGDFEGDTMGVPKYTRETIAAVVERKSRFIIVKKIYRLKYAMNAFKRLLEYGKALSATFDNGVENARHQELGIPTYFCHSYSS